MKSQSCHSNLFYPKRIIVGNHEMVTPFHEIVIAGVAITKCYNKSQNRGRSERENPKNGTGYQPEVVIPTRSCNLTEVNVCSHYVPYMFMFCSNSNLPFYRCHDLAHNCRLVSHAKVALGAFLGGFLVPKGCEFAIIVINKTFHCEINDLWPLLRFQ